MSEATRWLPAPDTAAAPFFDAAARGELLLQQCSECQRWCFPRRERCQRCGAASMQWAQASGTGTLFAHARLHRGSHPRHTERLPVTLATIDLDEGVRINSNLIHAEDAKIKSGARVQVDFEHDGEGTAVPVFRLIAD